MKNMKKILCTLTATAMVLSVFGIHACAKDVTITLDGEKVECPVPAKIEDGSTMVPMRAIFEALDMRVTWDDDTKTVTATKDGTIIKLTVGETYMECNGEKVELPVAAYVENGSTMVPVRAISESANATVKWNSFMRQVQIVSDSYTVDEDAWKENEGTINLSDMSVTGEGIYVDSNVVYILDGGDFEVKGKNLDAMIYVNALEKVKLRLNGVKLENTTGPAIFFDNCEKAFITISKNSENYIADGSEYEVDAKAAIFANDDIEIKGTGTLNVTSKSKHAIASDDDIKIEEGNIVLTSEKVDGIHANNTIKILGGDIKITSYGDGIQAEEDVVIEGGNIDITTTGVAENTNNGGRMEFGGGNFGGNFGTNRENRRPRQNGEAMGEGMQPPEGMENMTPPEGMENMTPPQGMENMTPPENMGEMPQGEETVEEDNTSTTKGIKGETDITITDGKITINSVDDGIHCAGTVNINGGEITVNSNSGKGISAHGEFVINNGTVCIKKGTEALESKSNFTINGATIDITASDDGINAGGTGARDVGANQGHDLTINGGTIYVNSSADGLDANGSIVINGGDIVIDGPTNNGNGALDSGGNITINGGTLIALGASGMAEAPGNNSTQPSFRIVTSTNMSQGTPITIKNAKGEVIYSYTAKKSGNSIVFSSDKLTIGETYTVKVGEEEQSITLSSVSTGGGGFGGFGGGRGQRTW